LLWIIGADSLSELHTWYQVADLVAMCRIVTAPRPGVEAIDAPELRKVLSTSAVDKLIADVVPSPRIDISATDVRNRVARGRSIRYLVPDAVAAYIRDAGLYRSSDDSGA
jgi:nicotinate-nucleotide adenylyltransferase